MLRLSIVGCGERFSTSQCHRTVISTLPKPVCNEGCCTPDGKLIKFWKDEFRRLNGLAIKEGSEIAAWQEEVGSFYCSIRQESAVPPLLEGMLLTARIMDTTFVKLDALGLDGSSELQAHNVPLFITRRTGQ